jgi:hypothetical protein
MGMGLRRFTFNIKFVVFWILELGNWEIAISQFPNSKISQFPSYLCIDYKPGYRSDSSGRKVRTAQGNVPVKRRVPAAVPGTESATENNRLVTAQPRRDKGENVG